jgi:hypothetical protein
LWGRGAGGVRARGGGAPPVSSARRLAGWALSCQLTGIADLLRRWRQAPPTKHPEAGSGAAAGSVAAEGCEADAAMAQRAERSYDAAVRRARLRIPSPEELVDDAVAAEIALACGLSRGAADELVLAADVLLVQRTLPRTARLLEAGLIEWGKVKVLTSRLGAGVSSEVATLVEAMLVPDVELEAVPDGALPSVARMTVPALERAVEAGILALDAQAAADRAKDARARRSVWTRPEADGMARLEASAGAEQIAAAFAALTSAARRVKRAGDARTLDQIRLDELLARVTGERPSAAAPHAPADAGAETDGEGDACQGGLAVSLTMPLRTFLALADDPAVLDGYGPIAGGLARQIALSAAANRPDRTTWRCVVTDDAHGSVVGIGRPLATPRHDPPARLADLVRATHPRCVVPGCAIGARRCDLDHRVPYDEEHPDRGPTCSCNMQPLCRTHHRLKTAGLLVPEVPATGAPGGQPPGAVDWLTPAGLRYRSEPGPATPPAAPAELREQADRRRCQRAAEGEILRSMNALLRAAYRTGRRHEREAREDALDEAVHEDWYSQDDPCVLHAGDLHDHSEIDEYERLAPVPGAPTWITALPWPATPPEAA